MGGCSKQGFPWGLLDRGGESWKIGGIAREHFATHGGNIVSMFHDSNARVFNNKRDLFR